MTASSDTEKSMSIPKDARRRPDQDGRIPVSAAERVARDHGLKQCLLIGWDGEMAHVVTYGATPDDCAQAAKAQDFWQGAIREFSFRGDADVWRPIATIPDDDSLVLAYVPDGRMMIWKASLLHQTLRERTPHHLQFPATHFRSLPLPP
jgi:hypothetical protein